MKNSYINEVEYNEKKLKMKNIYISHKCKNENKDLKDLKIIDKISK